ncbi:MAG: DUF2169 domain-containing protein [Polyangiaceae bacterium]|nr:DUF2169 domain-containing protein [Polyangiaceae bacterium]
MEVVTSSVLPVAGLQWISSSGVPALTVVCRATFQVQPIVCRLAEDQEPIVTADAFWQDDPRGPLRLASDLIPYKARAEVVLTGHAYAPQGRPSRSVAARLVVGSVDKSVEIMPDRWLSPDGAALEGTPPPRRVLRAETTAFGPISPTWPQRLALSPRLATRWAAALQPEQPLPEEFDPAFFNCAPLDQQLETIRFDERILLEHLHPRHARVLTSLPSLVPHAQVARVGRPPTPLALLCDTLWIDTDRGTCSTVFRGTVQLAYPDEPGVVTVHANFPDSNVDPAVDRTISPPLKESLSVAMPFPVSTPDTGAGRPASAGTALPFQPGAALGSKGMSAVLGQTGMRLGLASSLAAAQVPGPSVDMPPASPPMVEPSPMVDAPPAPPTVPAILTSPYESTPWSAGVGTSSQVGSIGQRLAMEQSLGGADWTARPVSVHTIDHTPPTLPVGSDPPPEIAPEPVAAIADEPTADAVEINGSAAYLSVYSEDRLMDNLRRELLWREKIEAMERDTQDNDEDSLLRRIDEEDPGAAGALLAFVEPMSGSAVHAALTSAVQADRRIQRPTVAVEGTLSCSLDDRESLRVLASAALALAPEDEALGKAVGAARAALVDSPLPSEIVLRLKGAVVAAYQAAERAVSPTELSDLVERTLVEQRAYSRRDVFGSPHIRAELTVPQGKPLVVYFPDAAASGLPLVRRFRARLLCEVRPREDGRETCPVALRVRAFVRIHRVAPS